MTDQHEMAHPEPAEAADVAGRRMFLRGLGKWSQAVIGGVLLGGGLTISHRTSAGAWANRRVYGGGGAWVNRYGGGGGWINGGGGGGAWVNRYGGGGGAWVNRRY